MSESKVFSKSCSSSLSVVVVAFLNKNNRSCIYTSKRKQIHVININVLTAHFSDIVVRARVALLKVKC